MAGRDGLRGISRSRTCAQFIARALACSALAFLTSAGASAQGTGGATDAAETLACDGTTIRRAICKPARVCAEAANIAPLQSGAGSTLPAARSNTITFSGIPAAGATVSYEVRVPALNTAALTPSTLVQDADATATLTTSGETIGPLAIGQSTSVTKTVAAGYSERLDIADRGSTLRVVAYAVTCRPVEVRGRITIIKNAIGGAGTFSVALTGPQPQALSLTTSGSGTTTASASATLDAGTYTVSETPPPGWALTGIACVKNSGTGTASGASVTLAGGDDVTCTVTNTKQSAALTLTKTARALSFSKLGEAAIFDIEAANSGEAELANVVVSDPLAELSPCSAPSLAAGQSLKCVARHIITQDDLSAGRYTNTAVATAESPDGTAATAVAAATITTQITGGLELIAAAPAQTYKGPGDAITFTYRARNTGNVPLTGFKLEHSNANTVSCSPALGGPLAPGVEISCTAKHVASSADTASPCIEDLATASAVRSDGTTLRATASAKSCLSNERTREIVSRFIARRTDLLASNEPDRARLVRRLNGARAASIDGAPVSVTGAGSDAAANLSVSSSLAQARAAAADKAAAREAGEARMALGANGAASDSRPLAFDLWFEAHYQRWRSGDGDTRRSGDFGIAYLGADYLVAPGLLVGALVQADWMSDFAKRDGSEVTGIGWMAGPYVSAEIAKNVYFDARGAWGTSSNDISPFQTYSDTFDTERWLAKANLTGNWTFDGLRISPGVGIVYVQETQNAYADTHGLAIPEHTAHLGRLTFGPEFGTEIALGGGNVLEPHVAITGMWDFDKSGQLAAGGGSTTTDPASDDELRFKIEGGATLRSESGASIRATASYDGIGAKDYSAWGGQLWVNVPIESLGDEKLFAGLLPPCCDGKSYVGGEPRIQIAQAADAAPATEAAAAGDAAPAPAAEEEPAYELPSVVVQQKKAAPVAAPKAKKPKPVVVDDEPEPKPQKKSAAKAKATPAPSQPASAPPPATAGSGTGSGGGTGGGSASASSAGGSGNIGGTGSSADIDLSGRAGQRTVEKVATVDVVTAKEIERGGARSLDEALDLVPGLYVRNAADGVPRIDIRGFRTRSIQLLLDGVPLNSSFDGQFDPRAIPVENIAKIKITKGASSVLYGPGGNAAVIDIITKSAAQGLHGSLQAEWSPERGSQEQLTASYGSKKLQMFLSASGLDQDHFELSDDFKPTALQPDHERVNSDRRDRALYANTVWSPSEVAKFGLSVNYRTGEYGKPPATLTRLESDFVPRTRFERVENYDSLSLQSSAWIRFNSQFSIRPTAYFNRLAEDTNAFDDANFSSQVRGNSFSESATTGIGGGGLQLLFGGSGNQLTIALDGHNESWSSTGFSVPCIVNASGICLLDGVREDFDTHHDVQVFSAAAEQELKLTPTVSAVLGAGYAEQWRAGKVSDDYTYLAGIRVDVTDTTAVRGSLARKIRFPTLRDLFALDGGNPDLETEVTETYEIGLEQTLPALKAAISIALFHSDAENFIQRQNGIFSNVSQIQFQGIETTARYRGIENLDVALGYTFLDPENKSPGALTDKVQNVPAHKFTASAGYKFDSGLALSADYLYVAGAYAIAGGGDDGGSGPSPELALDSYHVVNVGAAQDIPGTTAQLFGRVDNLFDENYVENFGFPQAGRTFRAGLKAKY